MGEQSPHYMSNEFKFHVLAAGCCHTFHFDFKTNKQTKKWKKNIENDNHRNILDKFLNKHINLSTVTNVLFDGIELIVFGIWESETHSIQFNAKTSEELEFGWLTSRLYCQRSFVNTVDIRGKISQYHICYECARIWVCALCILVITVHWLQHKCIYVTDSFCFYSIISNIQSSEQDWKSMQPEYIR